MDILNKMTPDAISALTFRPLQTFKKVDKVVAGWSRALFSLECPHNGKAGAFSCQAPF